MPQTLVIKTPDASRTHWNAVRVALNKNGFEVHMHHAALTDSGQTIVSKVQRINGNAVTGAEIERFLPGSNQVTILH
jgi:hypothetical protein